MSVARNKVRKRDWKECIGGRNLGDGSLVPKFISSLIQIIDTMCLHMRHVKCGYYVRGFGVCHICMLASSLLICDLPVVWFR